MLQRVQPRREAGPDPLRLSLRSSALASLLAASVALAGCRSVGESGGAGAADAGPGVAAGPTMPAGMLSPGEAGPGAGLAGAQSPELRVARNVKAGTWVELQVAREGDVPARTDFERWREDSRFVSLEAITLLHEPFARALPGFDLFLPRLFTGAALVTLATELEAFAGRSSGAPSATARELAAFVRETSVGGRGLWVLGP